MTRKDLNLSLDQNLMQRRTSGESIGATDPASRPKQRKQKATATTGHRPYGQTITIVSFGIINMAFLLAAGLWLSTLQQTIATPMAEITTNIAPRVEIMLVDANDRLNAMQQQLDDLMLAFGDHQQLTASKLSIEKEVQIGLSRENSSNDVLTAKEIPTTADNWYVNLGTFSSKEAATSLQRRLGSVGQQAQISHYAREGITSFELRLSGFDDRESAELAAGEIIEQADLSGLSVWKND